MSSSRTSRLPPIHRLLIIQDQPEADAVRAFIMSGRWRDTQEFTPVSTRNFRYTIYSFLLPPPSRLPCILKVAHAAPAALRPLRRLNALLSHWLRDPSRRALRGAHYLAAAGLPTYRPLACWQARRDSRWRDSFLLYAQIPARHSLRDYLLGVTGLPPDENARALENLTGQLADRVAALHRQGLRHNDLACGNWLEGDDGQIYLIDTDHVHRARWRIAGGVKQFYDLKDLRRLDLPTPLRRLFLHRYLGGRNTAFWWRVHQFWRQGASRPWRWLRRRLHLRAPSQRQPDL
ncbi:MAG: lipopolysaccharide kinase InaA family protein [Kiritimatiellae bacterium]|nr:lipopolysaccharide kinase InaA family protein [Kiritimatiellia bacterium]MDD4341355.1 lipopolysaccharide kinase InaA family protein [Kiritimatiellia bacterium]